MKIENFKFETFLKKYLHCYEFEFEFCHFENSRCSSYDGNFIDTIKFNIQAAACHAAFTYLKNRHCFARIADSSLGLSSGGCLCSPFITRI